MTANEERGVDLDALESYARIFGLDQPDALRLIAELRDLRAALVEMAPTSRASIGPDSERIRELEAQVAELLAQNESLRELANGEGVRFTNGADAVAWLQAPGPDDIVVSREALRLVLDDGVKDFIFGHTADAYDRLRAALSQPHPEEAP